MKRTLGILCIAGLFLVAACEDRASVGGSGWCPSMTFSADVHGAPATAQLVFEPQFEMGYVSGTITSQSSGYSFYGDTPIDVHTKLPTSSVMWVDVTAFSGERFRAEINWYPEGFVFTPNPFGGDVLTNYEFYCQD